MELMWQVEKNLLLDNLNDLITQASETADLANIKQLDQIATLQAFKQNVLCTSDGKMFYELANQWRETRGRRRGSMSLAESYPVLAQHFDLDLFEQALDRLDAIAHQIALLDAQIEQVEAQGMVEATPYYRKEKYLYLIHPQHDGERVREYIGANGEKQQEALRRVANWDRYSELQQERQKIQQCLNSRLSDLRWSLQRIVGWR